MNKLLFLFSAILLLAVFGCRETGEKPIMPWPENSWYWQYNGKPLLLLGASDDDNLFQWPEEKLIPHLDSMKSVGGNYVRNTMSDRVDKGFELYPFKKTENDKYDLNQWNDEYWQRFENFLNETWKRDIIVQIEVWDRFDYSRDNWPVHPFNPLNNINYSMEESGLDSIYPEHPGANKQPFFFTTPEQQNNKLLLDFQKKFVDKMLSYALQHNHVLYCMDNETSGEEAWAVFWANYIKQKAEENDKSVYVTEMWDNWDLKSEQHKRTFDNAELFDYCDVSQNNHQRGQAHWDNFQWVRNYIAAHPRPINTVKTYGADGGRHGTTNNAIDAWWRHVIGGAASARFHRPPSGLGLNGLTMNTLKAARQTEEFVKYWELSPGNDLLTEREENEAYLASLPGKSYVVFFPDRGTVGLNMREFNGDFTIRWMNVRNGEWASEKQVEGGKTIELETPGENEWVAVVTRRGLLFEGD